MADLLGLITGGLTATNNALNARDEGMAERRKAARDDLLARIQQEREDADASVRRDYLSAQTRTMNAPKPPRTQFDSTRGGVVDLDTNTFTPTQGLPQQGRPTGRSGGRSGGGTGGGTPPTPATPRPAAYEERPQNGGIAIYENGQFKRWMVNPQQDTPTLSEGERKTGALLQTAQEGYETLEALLSENATPPTLLQRGAASVGLGVGNVLSPQQLRQMDQAGYSLAEAWLRLTSGGAITPGEIENVKNAILPQPGDDPQTLEQKKRLRSTYISAIRTAAGRGAANPTSATPAQGPQGAGVTLSTGRAVQRIP